MAELPISANQVYLSNFGYLKINGIELAELNTLEIKVAPEIKTLGIMNSPTKGEITTGVTGTISFELHKINSRFKQELLSCISQERPFNFSLEATVYSPDKQSQESIYIDNCWMKGDTKLFQLKADGDFLNENYEAGFQVETMEFTDIVDDGNTWTSNQLGND